MNIYLKPSLYLIFLYAAIFTPFNVVAQDASTTELASSELILTEEQQAMEMDESLEEVSASSALIEKLRESGKTGIALFLISVVGFSFAFERLFNLRRSAITPPTLAAKVDKLWAQGDIEGVKKLAASSHSTLGRVVIEIVDHRDSTRAEISTMAGDVASREMRLHLQRAYPLAVVATISPLLGLFGTVYGMIGAFESVALAGEMGDPSIMAADIAFALMTTAIGLVIAVPALSAYHFFRIRTNMFALGLEGQLSHIINRWFGPNAVVPSIAPTTHSTEEK
jgi:biopolymer transport protein ExbB